MLVVNLLESGFPVVGLLFLTTHGCCKHHCIACTFGNSLPKHAVQAGCPLLELIDLFAKSQTNKNFWLNTPLIDKSHEFF